MRARRSKTRARRSGFTLIEMLIAASLLAVIGLAIAETLRAARDADRRLQARSERRSHDRIVLEKIARDLRGMIGPGGQYAVGIEGVNNPRAGGREMLSFAEEENTATQLAATLQAPPPPFDERDQCTISTIPGARRFGSLWPAGTGAIQTIMYEVDDDPATPERGLVRRPTTVTDPIAIVPEPVEIVSPFCVGIMFRYFDGTNWQTSWDSATTATLPQAIEVSVAMRDDDGTIRRLVEVVSPLSGRLYYGAQASTTQGATTLTPNPSATPGASATAASSATPGANP